MPIKTNTKKIFNDPVHGFISIPSELLFDLIEHPYFQRLRRIKQLGLTHLVYPGALHTRFQHALGAMHLMMRAIETLRYKGQNISDEEAEAAYIAILLHDIGHGPFSHALESSIINGLSHEQISLMIMDKLNLEFKGKLSLAIQIFKDQYNKHFLHQLVSSQLDVDRLDYLKRDSFFTGVSEGVIGTERIISMLDVYNDELVVEAKGIYSVENFLVSRRIMYWQVYLHKTSLSAEYLLMQVLKRARFLAQQKHEIFATPALAYFLHQPQDTENFNTKPETLEQFSLLDDFDIFTALKIWCNHPDPLLRIMSNKIVHRKLLRIEFLENNATEKHKAMLSKKTAKAFGLSKEEAACLVISDNISNHTYNPSKDKIKILDKNLKVRDMDRASSELNPASLTQRHTKYFILYPKEIIEE